MRNLSDYLRRCIAPVLALLTVFMAGDAWSQPGDPSVGPRHVVAEKTVGETTLIRTSNGIAVIRVTKGPMERVRVGDLIGLSRAVVREIAPGRLVLEETFTAKDGGPNLALIVIKEGERGGTRYLQRADEPHFTGTRPVQVTPATPDVVKPPPKKPGPM